MELQLMYALKHNFQINWTLMIMRKMWTFRDVHRPLPYAMIITTMLEHFGVFAVVEYKIFLDARDNKIDVDVIHKMRFFRDSTDMIYLHRFEHRTSPSENPSIDPPRQQHSYVHVESSSSGSKPSNQMIMDELLTLRGYITTRMDVLDVANQQVEVELRRLSNRLDYMDFDEDTAESES
ncbi:hypothetical protein Lal_00024293 [Lupinus albus]|nr:hypothetical protein Lal_00024293 [Lupinus albus]